MERIPRRSGNPVGEKMARCTREENSCSVRERELSHWVGLIMERRVYQLPKKYVDNTSYLDAIARRRKRANGSNGIARFCRMVLPTWNDDRLCGSDLLSILSSNCYRMGRRRRSSVRFFTLHVKAEQLLTFSLTQQRMSQSQGRRRMSFLPRSSTWNRQTCTIEIETRQSLDSILRLNFDHSEEREKQEREESGAESGRRRIGGS